MNVYRAEKHSQIFFSKKSIFIESDLSVFKFFKGPISPTKNIYDDHVSIRLRSAQEIFSKKSGFKFIWADSFENHCEMGSFSIAGLFG